MALASPAIRPHTPPDHTPSSRDLGGLFQAYAPTIRKRAMALLGTEADADEATQDVFLRIMARPASFDGRSQVSTWLYRVTTNHCLTVLRTRSRHARLLSERVAPARTGGGLSVETEVLLRDLLERADPRQAQAAVLVFVDGMTHLEAARALGCSKRTVTNLLSRFTTWARE